MCEIHCVSPKSQIACAEFPSSQSANNTSKKGQIFPENLLICLFSAWSDSSLSEGPVTAVKIKRQREHAPDDKEQGLVKLACPCLIPFKTPTPCQGQVQTPDLVHRPSLACPCLPHQLQPTPQNVIKLKMKFSGNPDNHPLMDNGNLLNENITVIILIMFNMKLVHSDFYCNETALWNSKKQTKLLNDFEAQNHARCVPLNVYYQRWFVFVCFFFGYQFCLWLCVLKPLKDLLFKWTLSHFVNIITSWLGRGGCHLVSGLNFFNVFF